MFMTYNDLRKLSKEAIKKDQENQQCQYNRKCKIPIVHRNGQLVAIKKLQSETGANLYFFRPNNMKPFGIIVVVDHQRPTSSRV